MTCRHCGEHLSFSEMTNLPSGLCLRCDEATGAAALPVRAAVIALALSSVVIVGAIALAAMLNGGVL